MTFLIKPSPQMARQDLIEILRYRRPGRSKTEKRFIREYIDTLPGVYSDTFGNRYCRIGSAPVLFSCHTDSVHTTGGEQSIIVDGDFVRLAPGEKQSNCLGADDGAGVWIMRELIKRKIPGLYIFHRDEETGGKGSSYIAENNRAALDGIAIAIAIDRKGYDSVITHQGSRCASDDFARSLASHLGGEYRPDSGGIFTDTANYTGIIAECTNLSCGYFDAHSPNESQSIPFAINLLDRLSEIDFSKITVSRDPAVFEEDFDYWKGSRFSSLDDLFPKTSHKSRRHNFQELQDIIAAYPDEVADYLDQCGITADEIADHCGIYRSYY